MSYIINRKYKTGEKIERNPSLYKIELVFVAKNNVKSNNLKVKRIALTAPK